VAQHSQFWTLCASDGPDSSVGIATELRAGRSGDRIPVRRDFPPSMGPPRLLYNGYQVFPGGTVRLGLAVDHSPPSNAAVKKGRAIPLPTLEAV
jgi:hypothetical protein